MHVHPEQGQKRRQPKHFCAAFFRSDQYVGKHKEEAPREEMRARQPMQSGPGNGNYGQGKRNEIAPTLAASANCSVLP